MQKKEQIHQEKKAPRNQLLIKRNYIMNVNLQNTAKFTDKTVLAYVHADNTSFEEPKEPPNLKAVKHPQTHVKLFYEKSNKRNTNLPRATRSIPPGTPAAQGFRSSQTSNPDRSHPAIPALLWRTDKRELEDTELLLLT